MKFFGDHFGQIMLLFILVLFLFMIWHMESISDTANVNWAREQAGMVLGAIIGPIATGALLKKQDNESKAPDKTDPPKEPKP